MSIVSRVAFVAGIVVAAAAITPARAQPYWRPGDVFVCASSGYRQNYCAADTRHGVILRRQMSDSACVEGRTWGYDGRGVWVTQGCKGEFQVVGRGRPPRYPPQQGGGGQLVTCNSSGYQQQYCPVDTRGGVSLYRRTSSSSCVRGRSWGVDRGGIWVDDGCQAQFMVGSGWDPGYQPLPPSVFYPAQVLRCESLDGRTARCGANTRGGVQLRRQVSNTPCYEGQNWGWDRHGIWVSGGCRADFSVGGYYR
ncbi:MAG: DUF3011 domain-containing protein [Proteobacteria bacterium]|nr:DUF3011 domain-containing protein [Pseudomonadota bacterium]